MAIERITIEYCTSWGYDKRAASLAEELRAELPNAAVELIASSGGVFEVVVDGRLVFSKKALGRFPEPGEVQRLIRSQ